MGAVCTFLSPLGLQFVHIYGQAHVSRLLPGSQAARIMDFQPNTMLKAINGICVAAMKYDEIVALVNGTVRPVTLTFVHDHFNAIQNLDEDEDEPTRLFCHMDKPLSLLCHWHGACAKACMNRYSMEIFEKSGYVYNNGNVYTTQNFMRKWGTTAARWPLSARPAYKIIIGTFSFGLFRNHEHVMYTLDESGHNRVPHDTGMGLKSWVYWHALHGTDTNADVEERVRRTLDSAEREALRQHIEERNEVSRLRNIETAEMQTAADNATSPFPESDYPIQADLLVTEFSNVHMLVHRIGDDNSDTCSENYLTVQAIQQQDIAYLHIQIISPDNTLDSTVGSAIINGAIGPEVGPGIRPDIYLIISSQLATKGPEVGPYGLYIHVDPVLDFNQKAIDKKKCNAMATSLPTSTYEKVSFDDVAAIKDKSNSSREIMPAIFDNTLTRAPVLCDGMVSIQGLAQRANGIPTITTTTLVNIEMKPSDEMRCLVYYKGSDLVDTFQLHTNTNAIELDIRSVPIQQHTMNDVVGVVSYVSFSCNSTILSSHRCRRLSSYNFNFNPFFSVGGMYYSVDDIVCSDSEEKLHANSVQNELAIGPDEFYDIVCSD